METHSIVSQKKAWPKETVRSLLVTFGDNFSQVLEALWRGERKPKVKGKAGSGPTVPRPEDTLGRIYGRPKEKGSWRKFLCTRTNVLFLLYWHLFFSSACISSLLLL